MRSHHTGEPGGERVTASGGRAVSAHQLSGVASTGDHARIDIDQRRITLPEAALHRPADVDAPPGSNNLPARESRVFEGREQVLAELAAPPATGTTAVTRTLHGLGGIGKTTLALHHARDGADRRCLTWWITAETGEQLTSGLADLTAALSPTNAAVATTDEAAAWAVQWLQAHHDWLLVLDNVEDPQTVTPLLGRLTTGQVLITTRQQPHWHDLGTPLRLDVLDPAASVEVLTGLAGRGDPGERRAAAELADELGHLPLALQQAGAYIAQTRTTVSGYLRQLRSTPAGVPTTAADGGDPQRTIERVWHHTLQSVRQRNPHAHQLLRLLAYGAPDNLPRDVLDTALDSVQDVDRALGLLNTYNMITLTPSTVTTHRLVQAVLRGTPPEPAGNAAPQPGPQPGPRLRRRPWSRAAAPGSAEPAPERPAVRAPRDQLLALLLAALPEDEQFDRWPRWRALLPHIEALAGHYPEPRQDGELALLLSATAFYFRSQGQPARSRPYDEHALAFAEQALGPDHPETATCLGNLAATHNALGRPDRALPLEQRALAITEAAHGPHHPDTALRLSNLAHTHNDLGRFDQALPLARRALAITEATLGPHHPDIATRLGHLAATHSALGRPDRALPLEQRALAITEAAHGPHHPDTALRLSNLAHTHNDLGRFDQALPLEQRALAITEATLGPHHPSTATRLSNLAATQLDLGRPDLALPLSLRALAVTEASLGPDHPRTALRLGSLAAAYDDLGRPDLALPLARRALAVAESTLGPDHPTTATRAGGLAGVLRNLGRAEQALPLARRALAISEAALGPDHPDTATRLGTLAATLCDLDRAEQALPPARRALAVTEAALGPDHPDTATRLTTLARVRAALGQPDHALALEQRALAVTTAALGPDHPRTVTLLGRPAAARSTPERPAGSPAAPAATGPEPPHSGDHR